MDNQEVTILTLKYEKKDIDELSDISKEIFNGHFCEGKELQHLVKKHSYFLTLLLCEQRRRKNMVDRILDDVINCEKET